MYIIPIIANKFTCNLDINGENKTLVLEFNYNAVGDMWKMSILNETEEVLISNIPLLPTTNLLEQYSYMNLGSAVLIPNTDEVKEEYPSMNTLKDNYTLFWGDNDELDIE